MKRILAFVLAAVMLLSLAACNKAGKDPEPAPGSNISTPSPEVIELSDDTPAIVEGDGNLDPDFGGNIFDPQEDSSLFDDTDDETAESIEPADLPVQVEEPPVEEDPEPTIPTLDKDAGEKSIASEYLDSATIDSAFVREKLYVDGSKVSDAVINNVVSLANTYSREGFLRVLENDAPIDDNVRYAAVLMCKLINVPYEKLWANGFVDESVANVIMETLENAEKEAKEAK